MLSHGRDELADLARGYVLVERGGLGGWHIDEWPMKDSDVSAAVDVYDAVLSGGSESIEGLLLEAGIDVSALLFDTANARDDITRSDICEYTAAGSVISDGTCHVSSLFMPNVPKMSRRKSDSGIDIIDATVSDSQDDTLGPEERLTCLSVKHTLQSSTATLRNALVKSISPDELTDPYIMTQLRVINGNLQQDGISRAIAARVYLFMRDFHKSTAVSITAVGVVPPRLQDDFRHELKNLPELPVGSSRRFRLIYFPQLESIHTRCS